MAYYQLNYVYMTVLVLMPGPVAQSVTCLAADTCLTVDTCLTAYPGVVCLFPVWLHTFLEIDHEIISTAIVLPSADARRVVVSYK